ncbi:hypothetical protein D3C85_397430 [compost metagenome]
MLGLEDVRAALQQLGGQPHRQLGEHGLIQRLRGRQVGRHAAAEQQLQGVAVLGDQAGVLGDADPRALHRGA